MTPADILAQADEARTLIDTLEALDLRRAPLQARYGPGGTFEADRKTYLCTLRDAVRADAQAKNIKMTVDAIDDAAHAQTGYAEYLGHALAERTVLAEMDAQRTALDHRIALAKALLYAHGRLAGLV